ncbi:MAG: hypothetical protein AAF437_01505 [Pseudomonadota bacterium]
MDDNDTPQKPTEAEEPLVEFARMLSEKYGDVFDEPIPERLAELVQRLREIKSD